MGHQGLIGKIRLMSNMTAEDVVSEIHSVFQGAVKKSSFPFTFLQPTGCGSRSLTVPSVSFCVDSKSCKAWCQTLYIMLEEELDIEKVCININLINDKFKVCFVIDST